MIAYQKIEIPFGYGQNEGVADYALEPPILSVAKNARINKDGSIEKRQGYKVLCSVSFADRLANWGTSLCVATVGSITVNNQRCGLYVLNASKSRGDKQGQGDPTGALPEFGLTARLRMSRGQTGQTTPDVATSTGHFMRCVCWQAAAPTSDQRIYAMVSDLDTNAVITGPLVISTGVTPGNNALAPKVIYHNSQFIVVYREDATSTIWARAYNCSTRTWGTDTAIITDSNAACCMDVAELTGSQDAAWFIAYRTTVPDLKIRKFVNLALSATVAIGNDPDTAISIYADNTADLVWTSWHLTGTGARIATHVASTLVPGLAATTIDGSAQWDLSVVQTSTTAAIVVGTRAQAGTFRPISWYRTVTSAGVLGTVVQKYGVGIATKAFASTTTSQILIWMRYDGGQDSAAVAALTRVSDGYACYLLVSVCGGGSPNAYENADHVSWRVLAQAAVGSASPHLTNVGLSKFLVTAVNSTIVGEAALAVDYVLEPTPYSGLVTGVSGIDVFQVRSTPQFSFAELGGLLWVGGGGATMLYDGVHVVEHGFYMAPDNFQFSTSGGGSLSAGSYAASATYQYTMANGARMISQPVPMRTAAGATSITALLNDDLDIVGNVLTLSQKFDAVSAAASGAAAYDTPQVVLYRTEANGSVFYEDTTAGGTGACQIDATGTGVLLLAQADTTLIGNRLLYTTDGILPAYPLPSCDAIVAYHNRIWGIWTEDKAQLVFTQPQQDGEVPYWHPFLALRVDQDGDCTALAVMGDTLVVFKLQAIYAIRGNGPDRKGQNSDIQAPQRVTTAYGTTKPRSVVVTPMGVFFHCDGLGICLLDQGFNVSLVSQPVETTLADGGDSALVNTNVTSAVANTRTERVYFTIVGGAPAAEYGYTLVYDWAFKQWYVDVINYDAAGTAEAVGIIDAIASGGNYYAIQSGGDGSEPGSGRLLQEDGYGDFHNDAALDVWITTDVRTAWIKPAGMQGFQRVRRVGFLAERLGAAALNFEVDYDYNTSVQYSFARTDAQMLANNPPGQVMLHLQNQRCESIRLRYYDQKSAAATYTAGYRLTGLAFEVGLKPGLAKRPALQQF